MKEKYKIENKLETLEIRPQTQAEKKGQISENLRISEDESKTNESLINEIDTKISSLEEELSVLREKTIEIRERKASSGATVDGLKKEEKIF